MNVTRSQFSSLLTVSGLCLALTACYPETRDGTAVGNPGNMTVEVTGLPEDVLLRSATLSVDEVTLYTCEGTPFTSTDGGTLDLLDPARRSVTLPSGAWCSATLWLDTEEQLVLVGDSGDDQSFQLTANPDEISVNALFLINGNTVAVGLPIARLLSGSPNSEAGEDVDFTDDSGTEDGSSVLTGSIVYDEVTLEGDLVDAGAPASLPEREPTGRGCTASPTPIGVGALLFLAPFLLRRQ